MTADVLTVVVTGSECTGKTTLARELAVRFSAAVSGEYARRYVDKRGAMPGPADVVPIARGQMAETEAAIARAGRLAILDTDLLSTVVYAHHYYGACPAWIELVAWGRLADLYLLLSPDVPWVPDGLLRDQPLARGVVHAAFRARLEAWRATFLELSGGWDDRRRAAETAIDLLLARRGDVTAR